MKNKMSKVEQDKVKVINNGELVKGADVEKLEVTDEEIAKINEHTLEEIETDDVYIFKAKITENTTDRDFEYFTEQAVRDMAEKFIGKPLIKDHTRSTNSQIGRIYDTELIESNKTTEHGEKLVELIAKAYILKTDSNADLISEIKAGIKKEVSIGVRTGTVECGICGVDNRKEYCPHWWGQEYDGKTAVFKLDNLVDAYELSLVAIPAMASAGAVKRLGSSEMQDIKEKDVENEVADKTNELQLKIKMLELKN